MQLISLICTGLGSLTAVDLLSHSGLFSNKVAKVLPCKSLWWRCYSGEVLHRGQTVCIKWALGNLVLGQSTALFRTKEVINLNLPDTVSILQTALWLWLNCLRRTYKVMFCRRVGDRVWFGLFSDHCDFVSSNWIKAITLV